MENLRTNLSVKLLTYVGGDLRHHSDHTCAVANTHACPMFTCSTSEPRARSRSIYGTACTHSMRAP